MFSSAFLLYGLVGWSLHNGAAASVLKRTFAEYTDTYEGLGTARTGTPFTKDPKGILQYSAPALYVTTGGASAGGLAYIGVKPQSGDNLAIFAEDVILSSSCIELEQVPFACAFFNVQAAASLPLSCIMTIQAMRLGANGIPEPIPNAAQTFDFTPDLSFSLVPLSIVTKIKLADVSLPAAKMFIVNFRSADTATVEGAIRALPAAIQPEFSKRFQGVGDTGIDGFVDSINYENVPTCTPAATLHKRTENIDKYDQYEVDLDGLPLKYDLPNGKLAYEPAKFTVATSGGITGRTVYTGISAKSAPNIALVPEGGDISARDSSKCVSIRRMNFGCTVRSVQQIAKLPAPCKLFVTAVDGAGNPGELRSYEHKPEYAVSAFQGLTVTASMREIAFDFAHSASKKYNLRAEIGVRPPGIVLFFSLLPAGEFKDAVTAFYDLILSYSVGIQLDDVVYDIVDCPASA